MNRCGACVKSLRHQSQTLRAHRRRGALAQLCITHSACCTCAPASGLARHRVPATLPPARNLPEQPRAALGRAGMDERTHVSALAEFETRAWSPRAWVCWGQCHVRASASRDMRLISCFDLSAAYLILAAQCSHRKEHCFGLKTA